MVTHVYPAPFPGCELRPELLHPVRVVPAGEVEREDVPLVGERDEEGVPGGERNDARVQLEVRRVDLRERGLVHSLRRFSRDFLGRAENYAADRGLDRCAPAALVHLHRRLGAEQQADLQARVLERLLQHGTTKSAPGSTNSASSAATPGERA